MEWDWQFLTPSSTPTTASFDCNTLQTPKLNAHFQDAFSPYGEQHQHVSATPAGPALDFGDHSFHAYAQDTAHHAQAYPQDFSQQHYHHPQQPSQPPLPPAQQPLQPAFAPQSSHGPAPAGPIGKEPQGMPSNQNMYSTSGELYQMHTPPPTRGSSTKRRSQRTESVVFGTPSSMTTRRPQQSGGIVSTDVHGLPSEGSPVKMAHHDLPQPHFQYSQAPTGVQLFDQQTNVAFVPSHLPTDRGNVQAWTGLDDPFSAVWTQPAASKSSDHLSCTAPSGIRRSSSLKSRPSPIKTNPKTNYGGRYYGATQTSPVKGSVGSTSVDPSLVYTSPSRPSTSDSVQSLPLSRSSSSMSDFRVPYQHNLTDPRQELGGARSGRFRQPQSQDPTRQFTQSFPRPELQRSNTVTGLRPETRSAPSDPAQSGMLARSNSAANLPRRSSPLKRERINRASLSSISETPKPAVRTSVFLTVDANGNARTETRVVEPSPTKSLRDKYSCLWEDSESDSDPLPPRTTSLWPNRNSSLANSRGDERHAKVAKLDPPLEDLENLHLPRSNSSASLRTPSKAALAAAAQLRRQSSAKKQRPSMHARRNTLASLNSSFESLASSVDLSADDRPAQNDAGSALRQMMAGRASTNGEMQQVQPDPISSSHRRPQTMAFEPHKQHQKSQSFAAPAQNLSFDRAPVFPVDCAPMQPAMPSLPHNTNYMTAPMFRCICSLPLDDGRGTVQCGLCAMYLHAACLGVDPQRLPSSYICTFCTHGANVLPQGSAQSFPGWGIVGM